MLPPVAPVAPSMAYVDMFVEGLECGFDRNKLRPPMMNVKFSSARMSLHLCCRCQP